MGTKIYRLDTKVLGRYENVVNLLKLEDRPWAGVEDEMLKKFFYTNKTITLIAKEAGLSKQTANSRLERILSRLKHNTAYKKYWDADNRSHVEKITKSQLRESKEELRNKYGDEDNWHIQDMLFTNKVKIFFLRRGIYTLGDVKRIKGNLPSMRNMGEVKLAEIRGVMHVYGIGW